MQKQACAFSQPTRAIFTNISSITLYYCAIFGQLLLKIKINAGFFMIEPCQKQFAKVH